MCMHTTNLWEGTWLREQDRAAQYTQLHVLHSFVPRFLVLAYSLSLSLKLNLLDGVLLFTQVELEEIESQAEEYPLTRGFLSLLESLTNVPIPNTLGAGHRIPGFNPYLEFVRDCVFLKFDSRAYRNPDEKVCVCVCACACVCVCVCECECECVYVCLEPL